MNTHSPKLSGSWPHAPAHFQVNRGCFIVTAGTYLKEHHFAGSTRLQMLNRAVLEIGASHGWNMEAWAVFPNHYHFVAWKAGGDQRTLAEFLKELHSRTAVAVNKLDGTEGRRVWHNYYDTELTFEKSYKARLNYVHQNAVRHGVVALAHQYPYCSASWFEANAAPVEVKMIYSFGIENLRVKDDFDVGPIA